MRDHIFLFYLQIKLLCAIIIFATNNFSYYNDDPKLILIWRTENIDFYFYISIFLFKVFVYILRTLEIEQQIIEFHR